MSETLAHIHFTIPEGWEETLSWQLEQDGFGVALTEQSFPAGYLDDEPVDGAKPKQMILVLQPPQVAAFRERFAKLAEVYGWQSVPDLTVEERDAIDWESAWRQQWKPFRCGGFVVHADFHRLDGLSLRQDDQPLQLVTGSAFGTGGHPSTRIALRVLRRWCSERDDLHSFLDVGMGSGILGTAAAMMGVKTVSGMDPDPPSAGQATATAAANGVGDACHFWQGVLEDDRGPSGLAGSEKRYDAVMANLQSGLLQRYALELAARIKPGGPFFAGGFMDRTRAATLQALCGAGFQLTREYKRGRWYAAEFLRIDGNSSH